MKESDNMATTRKQKAAPLTLQFEQEKETTGTIRFRETNVPTGFRGKIGTLYLTKPAHEELGSPAHITVTVAP